MKNKMKMTALLAASLAIGVAAFAQTKDNRLFLDLKDADIYSAVAALSRQTGLQFVIADRGKDYSLITLSLRDATPEDAIRNICVAAGARFERDGSGVYVIRFGPPTAEPVVAPVKVASEPNFPVRIRPRRADAVHILQQLTGRFTYDPDQGIREEYNKRGVSFRPASPSPVSIPLYQGGVLAPSLSVAEQNPAPKAPGDVNREIWLPGDTVRQGTLGGGGGAGGFGGQPGGGGGVGGGAGGGATQLTPGEGLVPDGIDYISYDPSDGSLVVQGTPTAVERLRNLIDLFDVRPMQVEIKVEFITTSQSVTKSFGIDWTLQRGAVFTGVRPGSFARTGDPIFLNYSNGNLVTRLRTFLLEGDGKVVNAPVVRTLNNQSANVFQQTQTTIFTATVASGAGGNITSYTPVAVSVTSQLSVRPRIQQEDNGDYYITMTLAPQISEFGQIRRSPDGQEIPDQLSQGVFVSTIVKDGDTIVLGGLNRTQTTNTVSKFPILADIPILGQFFRSTRQERNDQELLIFVTPRVIRDEGYITGP